MQRQNIAVHGEWTSVHRSVKNGAYSATMSTSRSTNNMATRTLRRYAYTTKGIMPM